MNYNESLNNQIERLVYLTLWPLLATRYADVNGPLSVELMEEVLSGKRSLVELMKEQERLLRVRNDEDYKDMVKELRVLVTRFQERIFFADERKKMGI